MKMLAAFLAIPVLVACAAGTGDLPSDGASVPGSASTPGPEATAPNDIPADVWQAILADLADRLGSPASGVSVLTAEAETWSDGSLGCPKDGEMYTQALVDGYQVVVEAAGKEYDYRVGSGTDVRLCESPPVGG
jgi:hypothetical protein